MKQSVSGRSLRLKGSAIPIIQVGQKEMADAIPIHMILVPQPVWKVVEAQRPKCDEEMTMAFVLGSSIARE